LIFEWQQSEEFEFAGLERLKTSRAAGGGAFAEAFRLVEH
jgi:hypothetical protein